MKYQIKKLLREGLLSEGIIEVPKESIDKAGVLFDIINRDFDGYVEKASKDVGDPNILFKNYFKLNDQKGNPLNISVGLYDDINDSGMGRMDTSKDVLLLNMAFLRYVDAKDFERLITHELVHAMDPLVRDIRMFGRYYRKKGADPLKDTNKFWTSQHEYSAELTPLVNRINKISHFDENKVKWIFWILNNVKFYDDSKDLYNDTVIHFGEGKPNGLFKTTDDYWNFVWYMFQVVKPWSTKEKVYKQFLKDLYKGITKQ